MGVFRVDGELVLHTALYGVIFVCGLITSITSGLAMQAFGGTCVLYGGVNCTTDFNLTVIFTILEGKASICTFVTAVNVLVSVLLAAFLIGYHLYHVFRSRIVVHALYQMWLKVLLVSTSLATFVTLVSACTLTVGLSSWCNAALDAAHQEHVAISACEETEEQSTWKWYKKGNENPVHPERYYELYTAAETSCWISVCVWMIEAGLYVRHLVRNRQNQRVLEDAFTIEDLDSFS